jgi:hypothetical protein
MILEGFKEAFENTDKISKKIKLAHSSLTQSDLRALCIQQIIFL